MTTASTPQTVDAGLVRNVTDLVERRVATDPDSVAFLRCTSGRPVDVTVASFRDQARRLAKGLVAQGLGPGERVLIMSPTRYEWALGEMAVWYAGGVVMPINEVAAPAQLAAALESSQPRLVLAAGAAQVVALKAAGVTVPIWTMDSSVDDLGALAASGAGSDDTEIDRRRTLAGLDDVATIVFTAGTSDDQKGVLITHGNLVLTVLNMKVEYADLLGEGAVTVVALPLARVLARTVQLLCLATGIVVAHDPDPAHVLTTCAQVRPTFLVVVPRILEKVRDAARDSAVRRGQERLFQRAEEVAEEWGRLLEARQDEPFVHPSPRLRLQHWAFERMYYAPLRDRMGGRLRWMLSGAAPLDPSLARFFWGLGIPVLEGYGITETTGVATGTRPGDIRPGTVGTPLPGMSVRLEDGEVLISGVGVARGYLERRDDAFLGDWFRTGDLGSLDAAGRLTIHGRRDTALVTAWGRKVSPERWEYLVEESPLIAAAVMIGDGRPYLSAILALDREGVVEWARLHHHPNLATRFAEIVGTPEGVEVTEPAIVARVAKEVDRVNAGLSASEQVRRFVPLVLDRADGMMSPRSPRRRDAILATAAVHVEAMYAMGEEGL